MKDVTNELTPELASLAAEFKKLDVFYAYTVRTIREKMPIFAGHCTDRELKQIINIVIDAYVDTDEATKAENEACAELMEHLGDNELAAAIRARVAK